MNRCINVNGIIKKKADSKLNSYKCTMHNDLELYNVHGKSVEIEKWSIFSKMYIMLRTVGKHCLQTEYNCSQLKIDVKGYRQIKGECKTCQDTNFDNTTEQL